MPIPYRDAQLRLDGPRPLPLPVRTLCGTLSSNIRRKFFMRRFIIPLALAGFALPTVASAELPKDTQEAIVKMGHVNDPKTASLFVSMHKGVPANIDVSRDLSFGSDPAQKLDVFTSGQGAGKPILIYVHGGGFT